MPVELPVKIDGGVEKRFAPGDILDPATLPAHAPTHEPGGTDPLTVDAIAATGSLRTLGIGALQGAPGDHSHAGGAVALAYTPQVMTINGASRQPSVVGAIQVYATIRLVNASTLLASQSEEVFAEISPDDLAWTQIESCRLDFAVLIVGGNSNDIPLPFIVPTGFYYRFTSTGTGASSITSLYETGFGVTASPGGPAGGQLDGTYPNPDVIGLTETSGPDALTIGAVANGQYLKRSGATIVGDIPAGTPGLALPTGYTTPPAMTIGGAGRQPSATRPVFVAVTLKLDCDDGETETVNIQLSPDDIAPYVTIENVFFDFSVTGVGVGGGAVVDIPMEVWIPAGQFYRFTGSGTGTGSIVSHQEMVF